MKQKLCMWLCLLGLMAGPGRLWAQITAVQFGQSTMLYNVQSTGGQPISTVSNTPPGSNGKLPTVNSSFGSVNPATSNQFVSVVSFGAVAAPTNWMQLTTNAASLTGTTVFSGTVAQNMGLPYGLSNNVVTLVQQRLLIGVPYVSSPVSYNFGSIIPPPANDANGKVLTNNITSYWQTAPYNPGNSSSQYYYSPNAGVVFATQPGQVQVTWVSAGAYTDVSPLNYVNPGGAAFPNFLTNGAYIYLLYTTTYIVSGVPVKPPEKMYWTEGSFQGTGYPVNVANGVVSTVHVVYNSQFPTNVTLPYQDPDVQPITNPTNLLQEFRTLWFDPAADQIRAYNAEGRVFIELLGAPVNGGTTKTYLGFEIVDVTRAPSAQILTVNLGDQMTPYADGFEGQNVTPYPIQNTLGSQYFYQFTYGGVSSLYADLLTPTSTAMQSYWLSTGVAGLQWPNLFDNYNLVWPADPAAYSHYIRPLAATQSQASQTSVQLDGNEDPSLDYQDPLDQPRGFLTTTNTFYTWLTPSEPAHRALLRFNSGNNVRFERVFSYLSTALQNNAQLAGSVATNLSAWNPTNATLNNYASGFNPPYVTNVTVSVGQQITDPPGEIGSTNGSYGDYWAGYINQSIGTSFDPYTYVDPFANGFTVANAGAIIPVNAIPGSNTLEVLWFRQNTADVSMGFQPVYWPAIIADYTIQWPQNAPQIVMAGNAGSGPLASEPAAGVIYYQNDPTLPGYNPNEEHAVMLGGQAYALRDDLNVTNTTTVGRPFGGYSSAPFTLVQYSGDDGRPAMLAFQVLRENPAAGVFFDYVVPAGTMLQAPMPLPLMAPPIALNVNYPNGYTNYNTAPTANAGDLPAGWNSGSSASPYGLYGQFTFQDRNNNFWVYRGLNAGLPPLQAGSYNAANNTFGNLPAATAVLNTKFASFIHLSRLLPSLTVGASNLPPGLLLVENVTNGLSIQGTPTTTGTYPVNITVADTDGSSVSALQTITVVATGSVSALGPLVIVSTNQYTGNVNTYSNRPPTLAQAPTITNSFTMRFYYKTLTSFAWPALGNAANWPPVGTIVPYLRPFKNGAFSGDGTSTNTASLDIVYRPVWPGLGADGQSPLPHLNVGQTLTTAINGLAAVRGQDSVKVIYQQSIATNSVLASTAGSVVLYDPTVQKKASLANLNGLPAGVVADAYNGLSYFPNLPPNLISRVWFDPNGTNLVLTGQFTHDLVNGDYVQLNVLRGDDLAAVNALCPSSSANYATWTNDVASLAASVFTKFKDPTVPGSYVIDTNQTVIRGVGDLVEITNSDTAVDSYALSASGPGQGYVTYVVANGLDPKYAGDPVSVYIARVGQPLFPGALVLANAANASPFSQLITFEHTADLGGNTSQYLYDWRIQPPVNGSVPQTSQTNWTQLFQANPGPIYTLGATGIQGLGDNYVSMRYGQIQTNNNVVSTNWSPWANPILAQGWIKRVTENIDPIAGQTQNLYNNPATTTASLIALAGSRWVGNVPLNAASLTNNGLIQIYETLLNVGKSLSINSGINYGPANQALLLAAGYLNDFYDTLGNDAWANSLNPTIGFGTDNQTYGSIATSQFVFEGQEPTLLEQNLAFLRGRDDSLSPGVDLPPVYNHLFWNYTYGLSAGQVMYALNYNITDQNGDGVVNAADAAAMFPQGHGDAYGHYLTALMNYYELLMNPNFDWVPQSQAVSVLGATVQVNYQDETKFATTAAALARTGRQVFDLTWRQDYVPGTAGGWDYFASNHVGTYTYVDNNGNTQPITRYWGLDHWAARTGQGTYLNWVVGNSILPPKDTNPNDQGIQIVDRTTVQDLQELPASEDALQNDLDNANAGFTPLGLSQNAIPFDINPQQVTGANPQTHFEQIYARAVQTLNNAVVAFDAAQNVTANLRKQQNSLTDLKAAVTAQELAYNDQLIELYGTPYPDDVGAGQTYPQGYTGPDLVHFMYVDGPATNTYGGILPDPFASTSFNVSLAQLPADWAANTYQNFDFIGQGSAVVNNQNTDHLTFNVGPDGFSKPSTWASQRGSVGSIQTAAAAVNASQDAYRTSMWQAQQDYINLSHAIATYNAETAMQDTIDYNENVISSLDRADSALELGLEKLKSQLSDYQANILAGVDYNAIDVPTLIIAGTADGGDEAKAALVPEVFGAVIGITGLQNVKHIAEALVVGTVISDTIAKAVLADQNSTLTTDINQVNAVNAILSQMTSMQNDLNTINQNQTAMVGAQSAYQTLVSQGNRIQQERLTFRQHTAAQVQGFTVANSAFLVFQNEDLERYNTLFNLAAEYAWMAANAYDYETGLLGTPAGQSYLNQIISSCALGVVQNGQPQISGTTTGDPGLANALAEMHGDFEVLKGRLGFNNPDGYGTTVSLRQENYRINAGSTGDNSWQQVLQQGLMPDLLADPDVKRNCLQIDNGSGAAVPGIELTFSTTVADGLNLFGRPLGGADHPFSATSFATKIFSVGVDLDGYVGMANPVSNSGAGGTSPTDPTLDPNVLSGAPYIYLIPCGSDSMRSPPLGDTSTIRTWNVDDVAIPLPFNIGASDFSHAPFYQAANSLSEPLFAIRKHQAFRPVSTLDAFNTSIYGANGSLAPSQYTNQRLIGRSVWNSKWKLIIPGKTLLANPNQGLVRFINTVKDIHLYFVTYSYAGN